MEQWIGSVHSKMAWRTHFFFFFGVYRVLEKSSSYIYILCIYLQNEDFSAFKMYGLSREEKDKIKITTEPCWNIQMQSGFNSNSTFKQC